MILGWMGMLKAYEFISLSGLIELHYPLIINISISSYRLGTSKAYITYSQPRSPWTIAHKTDLFLLQDITTAIMVPRPTPGTYTGYKFPEPPSVTPRQEAMKTWGIMKSR
jgi:hypothetical protein